MATRGGFEKFKHNPAGYRAILQSASVAGILEAKGQRVASAVTSRLDIDGDWKVFVSTVTGRTRARTLVSGVPMRIEQKQAILGSAIDAGRG